METQEEFKGKDYIVKASHNGLTVHKRFSPGASIINIPSENIGSIEYSSYRIWYPLLLLVVSITSWVSYFLGYLKTLQAYSFYLFGGLAVLTIISLSILWWNHRMGRLIITQLGRQEPIVVKIDKNSADRIVKLVERI